MYVRSSHVKDANGTSTSAKSITTTEDQLMGSNCGSSQDKDDAEAGSVGRIMTGCEDQHMGSYPKRSNIGRTGAVNKKQEKRFHSTVPVVAISDEQAFSSITYSSEPETEAQIPSSVAATSSTNGLDEPKPIVTTIVTLTSRPGIVGGTGTAVSSASALPSYGWVTETLTLVPTTTSKVISNGAHITTVSVTTMQTITNTVTESGAQSSTSSGHRVYLSLPSQLPTTILMSSAKYGDSMFSSSTSTASQPTASSVGAGGIIGDGGKEGFVRIGYYNSAKQTAQGLTFLGNYGGQGSGRWTQ